MARDYSGSSGTLVKHLILSHGANMSTTVEAIESGHRLIAGLEIFGTQFESAIESDRRDWALTEPQERQNTEAHVQRVRDRIDEVRAGWLADAQRHLQAITANPPPPACKDDRAKFEALHRLVAMPPAERVQRIREAIANSDRTTFDAFAEAPAYVALVPPSDRKALIEEWDGHHSRHPRPGFHELQAILNRVNIELWSLETRIAGVGVVAA